MRTELTTRQRQETTRIGHIILALINSRWDGNHPSGLVGPKDLPAINNTFKVLAEVGDRYDMTYDDTARRMHAAEVLNQLWEEASEDENEKHSSMRISYNDGSGVCAIEAPISTGGL